MNKKINSALAILLMVLIAILAGWSIYKNVNKNKLTITPVSKNDQQQATTDNYYRKYLNEEKGVSFVYPKWWGDVELDGAPTFLKNLSLNIQIGSQQTNPMYTGCLNGAEEIMKFFGKGTTEDDIISCKKVQLNGQTSIQSIFGSYGTLDAPDSYGVFIETVVFSPDQNNYITVIMDRPDALNCRKCGTTYKEFVDNERSRMKNLDACVQGEARVDKSKEMHEIVSPCQLSDDETRALFELNNFIQSIKIKNKK